MDLETNQHTVGSAMYGLTLGVRFSFCTADG